MSAEGSLKYPKVDQSPENVDALDWYWLQSKTKNPSIVIKKNQSTVPRLPLPLDFWLSKVFELAS